jgi:beta-glucosidase
MTEYDITKGMTYMYFTGKPVYPFGHGLSYTTFRYSRFRISPKRSNGSMVHVTFELKNTGRRAGDEVVQLYVRDAHASVKRPIRELRGFERVSLKPGEWKTVGFNLPAESLAFYDVSKKAFATEPGTFEVYIGSSSEDVRFKGQFELTSPGQWPQ